MKRHLLLLLLIVCCSFHFANGQSTGCPPNIDFEYGSTSVWTFATGSCCPITMSTGFGTATSGRHTLTSGGGTDAYGFFPVVPPGGGSYALKLGNSSVGAQAEAARYILRIPAGSTDYALVYRYAVVLQDGGSSHDTSAQPRFQVNAYDSLTGAPITCAQYKYFAGASIPGFYTSLIASDVLFKTWTTETINLSGFSGRTVILDFASGDCDYSGHFGYGYVDASCGLFAITTVGCDSGTAYLTAPGGFSRYEWYDSSTFSTVLDTFQTAAISMPTRPTTYAVIIFPFSGFGCRDTLYTRILPSRLTTNKSPDTSICFGGGTSITLSTGARDIPEAMPLTYSWSPAATLDCATCENPVATPLGPTTYRFTVSNAVGCSWTDSIRIVGNLLATTVTSTPTSCFTSNDGTATATITAGTPPYRYIWSTSPVQTTMTATGLYGGMYTVNVIDTTGCSGTFSIRVNQPPANRINIGGFSNPTTCGGRDGSILLDSLIPSRMDTITYLYTDLSGATTPQTLITMSSSTGTITITGLPEGTYSNFTVLTTLCPYNVTGAVTLTDPAVPSAPTIIPQSYCQYETAVPVSAIGSSLLWYSRTISPTATAPTPSTAYPHYDTFYVTQTVSGCVSLPATDIVRIKPKPTAPPVVDTTYCQYGRSVGLVGVGDSLLWYNTISGGTHIDSTPRPATNVVGVTTWYVSQTTDGCVSDRAPLNVTILYQPDFKILASKTALCQHDTINLSYDGVSLVSPAYNWSLPKGTFTVVGTKADSSIMVRFDSVRSQSIILRTSNYNGRCFSYDTLKINVVERPYASFYLKQNICEGDTVSLALSERSGNADHYTWDFDDAKIVTSNSNTGGPYLVRWATTGVQIVKLTAITVEGCIGKEMLDTVRIIPRPDARILSKASSAVLCLEDSLYLSAYDTTNYGNSYEWAPAHFFHNSNRPVIWGRIEVGGYVSLKVTNAFGCTNSDSVLISPEACCKVTFPNAFTPNNDGRNDRFRPVFNGYHRFSGFRIFNRWGQTVYESINTDAEWDGTFGGVPQDMGIYFYFIKYDCGGKTIEEKGDFTLIR